MWTKMAAWKNLDFDFGVHKNHPNSMTTTRRWVALWFNRKMGPKVQGFISD